MKITQKTRHQINKIVCPLGRAFHDLIPLNTIDAACREAGLMLVDEECRPWSGLLCGREGHARFDLASVDPAGPQMIDNAVLVLDWCKFDSGRYEIVAYVS